MSIAKICLIIISRRSFWRIRNSKGQYCKQLNQLRFNISQAKYSNCLQMAGSAKPWPSSWLVPGWPIQPWNENITSQERFMGKRYGWISKGYNRFCKQIIYINRIAQYLLTAIIVPFAAAYQQSPWNCKIIPAASCFTGYSIAADHKSH